MINLSDNELKIVKEILQKYIPEYEVRVFGSRIKDNCKKYSDLDLAIKGEEEVPLLKLSELREAFQESDLPFRVDFLDIHWVSEEFENIIEENYEVIQNLSVANYSNAKNN